MMFGNNTCVFLLSLLVSLVTGAWFGGNSNENDHATCKLYLAPSHVMGDLGVFAGVEFEEGTTLDIHDLVIPLWDFTDDHWTSYPWSDSYGATVLEGLPVHVSLPVLGEVVNRHAILHNIAPMWKEANPSDSTGLHRSRDHGVGAFSYQVLQYRTTSPISAGSELIVSDAEMAWGVSPTEEDLQEVDRILKKVKDVVVEVDGSTRQDVLDLISSGMAASARQVFPQTLEQLDRAVESGSVASAWDAQDLQVPIDYLAENGVCLDHIRVGVSSIPQAGRGAFASRALKKDTVMSAMPVHPMLHDDMILDKDRPEQLQLNYCFGHSQSSLLLCPYAGGGALINHAPGTEANVKLEWSSKLNSQHETLFKESVDHLVAQSRSKHPQLVLQFVATRDIQPGEELLFDYGMKWKRAWEEHSAQKWEIEEEDDPNYKSAAEWNAMKLPVIMTTEEEEEGEPYPENLFLGIQLDYDPSLGSEDVEEINGVIVRNAKYSDIVHSRTSTMWPISILERVKTESGIDYYTIILHNHPALAADDENSLPPNETVKIVGVPRDAILFVDQADSTDVHLPNVFRHDIEIPGGVFAENWLDAADEAVKS